MNLTVAKVNNGFTVLIRDPSKINVPDHDVYVARTEEELMETLRSLILTKLVIERLTGETDNVPF